MADELEDAQDELARATARAVRVGEQQQSVALERPGGKLDAKRTKTELSVARRKMERAQRDVQRAAERTKREMERRMEAVRRDLAEQMGAVNEALEPIRKRIKLMEEGLETLGLYVSAAQGVVTIREGERADALEPIVIRQMVLTMDEETGLFAEKDGLVAENVEAFDEWLLANPEHVQQLIPETKAVVALVARWREREHGNPWSHDPKDKVTHFLIRNGDALFRTTVNEFHAGRVLIPTADEFVRFFFYTHHDWKKHQDVREPLTPGTREYADAMEASDRRGRHYLRIGLILQGLVDNSEVFEPLHPAGINMLTDPSARSEKVRIVTDAEGGLGSGEESFAEWQERLNSQLRPGMRIIGAFGGKPWQESNEWGKGSGYSEKGHSRVYPTGWNHPIPPSGVPLRIEWRRGDGGLTVPFERGTVYDPSLWTADPERSGWGWRGGERPAKRRASVTIYPRDGFVLAYDLIESSERLARFLRDRRNRENYRELFPLIRSALFAKRAEETAEAPFKKMLAGVLARENGVSVEEAEREVPELVRWFKLKNRWARALTLQTMAGLDEEEKEDVAAVLNERTTGGRLTSRALEARRGRRGEPDYSPERYRRELERASRETPQGNEHEALAVRAIIAEHARRVADRRRPLNHGRVAELRNRHPEALLIARPRKGGYLVLLPAHPTENVYVHELEYPAAQWGPDGQGALKERRDWRLVSTDRASRWTIAHEHPRWAEWTQNASERDYLSGPEFERIVDQLRRRPDQGERLMMISYRKPTVENRGRFTAWVMTEAGTVESGPSYKARDYYWKRSGGTTVLLRPKEISYWMSNETEWSLNEKVDEEVKPPWEDYYPSRHAGEVLWGPDPLVVSAWIKLREAHLVYKRAERALNDRVSKHVGSIASQWRALREIELHEGLLAEVPDATWDEWQEHREKHPSYWDREDGVDSLRQAIRELLLAGVDPTGMTAQEALDRAILEGMPLTWKERGAREQAVVQKLPWGELIFGAEPVETPEDPEAIEEPVEEEEGDFVVLDPEDFDDEPEDDEFDALRDAFRGATK